MALVEWNWRRSISDVFGQVEGSESRVATG
jgi:hypothetical protein